jgi:hypothetical protein
MSARAKSPPAATRPAPKARSGSQDAPLGGAAERHARRIRTAAKAGATPAPRSRPPQRMSARQGPPTLRDDHYCDVSVLQVSGMIERHPAAAYTSPRRLILLGKSGPAATRRDARLRAEVRELVARWSALAAIRELPATRPRPPVRDGGRCARTAFARPPPARRRRRGRPCEKRPLPTDVAPCPR